MLYVNSRGVTRTIIGGEGAIHIKEKIVGQNVNITSRSQLGLADNMAVHSCKLRSNAHARDEKNHAVATHTQNHPRPNLPTMCVARLLPSSQQVSN